jgi:predicted RNase H-like HicB family nuclease
MKKEPPMLRFMVLIERSKTGYSAYAPDLPGCIAVGKTLGDVEACMHKSLEYHLELMAERGETLPEATHVIATNMSVRDPFSDQESPKPAALLGRKGGAAKSETKAQAARENGRKGGRPRKNQAPSLPSSG